MNILQNVAHCYLLPAEQREFALKEIITDEKNRSVIEVWLQHRPGFIAESPLLADLKNRIAPPFPTPPPSDMESKILSGNSHALIEHFYKSPAELYKHIDLIKAHIQMNTIPLDEAWISLLLDHASTQDVGEIFCYTEPSFNLSQLTLKQSIRH